MTFKDKTYGLGVDFFLIENMKPKEKGKLSKKYSKKFKLKKGKDDGKQSTGSSSS